MISSDYDLSEPDYVRHTSEKEIDGTESKRGIQSLLIGVIGLNKDCRRVEGNDVDTTHYGRTKISDRLRDILESNVTYFAEPT
jgi:hypothetical protein